VSKQTKPNTARVSSAKIDWSDGQPHSSLFGDIYFSQQSGVAETEHVFINASNLPARFAQQDPSRPFVIGETGFGTGLNFLSARQLWLNKAPKAAHLHFISCEKYPLSEADLRQAHQLFSDDSELASGCEQLQKLWPKPVGGFHRLSLDEGRIQLTLLYGDATQMLSQLNAQIDCWFLDGFAPSKNPEMWRDELFAQLGRLSHADTTLATFTCAGLVKRGLKAAGFEIRKIPGYGRKREMLCANFTAPLDAQPNLSKQQPWLKRPPTQTHQGPIAVIGGGLSGATTAFALARRGYKVDLYEQHPQVASEGSGNPQGALYAKLPAKPTPQSRLHLAGLAYSTQLLRGLNLDDGETAELCGLLQLALDDKEAKRFEQLSAGGAYPEEIIQAVTQQEASELAGTECGGPALHFPDSGWVSPARFSQALTNHPNIQLKTLERVDHLQPTDSGWQIGASDLHYQSVVLCTAWRTDLIDNWHALGLKPIRGQTTWAATSANVSLNKVVCGKGYISPALDNQFCFGSSFVIGDTSIDLRNEEHEHNLQILEESLPQLSESLKHQSLSGKASQRAGSRDYIPLVGALCDQQALKSRYEALKVDATTEFEGDAPWLSGLYVNLGHGSKGLITCPLSAEVLAAQINAEPYPIEQQLVDILSPQRFAIRDLIRSEG
jgi:tRNA 5-methylaminomethyl-2-thiouridine biosynthesis bifunctional protein